MKVASSYLSAIVLAGGRSSRMGRDKALLEVQGVPLLQKVCQAAATIASPVSVIAPQPEIYRPLLPPGCQLLRELALPGGSLPHGPLVGFAQALRQVRGEWALLLACDLPYLTGAEIARWPAYLPATPPAATALLPRHPQGWWEPLCGFYRRRCLPSLEEFIAPGGRSFQSWLAGQVVAELPVQDSRCLFNCNTPQDFSKVSDLPGKFEITIQQ